MIRPSVTLMLCLAGSIVSGDRTTSLTQQAPACSIEITAPLTGATVGRSGQIRGNAMVPPGLHAWAFVRKAGLARWWPQPGGSLEVSGGNWVAAATFGNANDEPGSTFEITAVIVDAAEHSRLNAYVATSDKEGHPGTTLPPAASGGCAQKQHITVTLR